MKGSYVESLTYRILHVESESYEKAPPLEHEYSAFSIHVQNNIATFRLKERHATVDLARAIIEPFVRAWELDAELYRGFGAFQLAYRSAEICDPKQPPGQNVHDCSVWLDVKMDVTVDAVVERGCYPSPPANLAVNADVETMLQRFNLYRQGRDTPAGMAYFCLTMLESMVDSNGGSSRREAVAQMFRIDKSVLGLLGQLTAKKGGTQARKAAGIANEFTLAERQWLEAVVKAIIRRAAAVAYDENEKLDTLTMSDFPAL